ncbi:MAG TPA: hypothetical protein DD473_25115 [Planctomycetaceae bacterium]|nr:hypothetical protein [Planctomycetaceae bacterium]|tara:strand:- start:516 stop:1196 length:681 start_codon:yes stop_codon:yes gene_type:complete
MTCLILFNAASISFAEEKAKQESVKPNEVIEPQKSQSRFVVTLRGNTTATIKRIVPAPTNSPPTAFDPVTKSVEDRTVSEQKTMVYQLDILCDSANIQTDDESGERNYQVGCQGHLSISLKSQQKGNSLYDVMQIAAESFQYSEGKVTLGNPTIAMNNGTFQMKSSEITFPLNVESISVVPESAQNLMPEPDPLSMENNINSAVEDDTPFEPNKTKKQDTPGFPSF